MRTQPSSKNNEPEKTGRSTVLPLFRFYTLAEVAGLLGISRPKAYRLVRSGELPAEQVGPHRQWCIHAADILTMIQGRN